MKRIINTIIVSFLLLACPAMHAGLNQTMKNSAHYALKKVGANPGWVAYAVMTYGVYKYIEKRELATETEEKIQVLYRTLIGSSIAGAAAIAFSAACNWWASRL